MMHSGRAICHFRFIFQSTIVLVERAQQSALPFPLVPRGHLARPPMPATPHTSTLWVMPPDNLQFHFAQAGTFALPHVRHSTQSNAKEPASPSHSPNNGQKKIEQAAKLF